MKHIYLTCTFSRWIPTHTKLYIVRFVVRIPLCPPSYLAWLVSSLLIFVFIKVISFLFEAAPEMFSPAFPVLYVTSQRAAGYRSSNFLEVLIYLCISQHLIDTGAKYMNDYYMKKEERERRKKRGEE